MFRNVVLDVLRIVARRTPAYQAAAIGPKFAIRMSQGSTIRDSRHTRSSVVDLDEARQAFREMYSPSLSNQAGHGSRPQRSWGRSPLLAGAAVVLIVLGIVTLVGRHDRQSTNGSTSINVLSSAATGNSQIVISVAIQGNTEPATCTAIANNIELAQKPCSNQVTFTLNDLTADTIYHIQIQAKSGKTLAKSAPVVVRTLNLPPAAPAVTVSNGPTCKATCSNASYCTDRSCAYVEVTLTNFSESVNCSLDSQEGSSGWLAFSASNGKTRSPDWYGYPGEWINATCGGVTSPRFIWPS